MTSQLGGNAVYDGDGIEVHKMGLGRVGHFD